MSINLLEVTSNFYHKMAVLCPRNSWIALISAATLQHVKQRSQEGLITIDNGTSVARESN